MPDGNNIRIWARTVILLAAALFAATVVGSQPAGFILAVHQSGVNFEMKAASFRVAFEIGQSCSKSDSCRSLLA